MENKNIFDQKGRHALTTVLSLKRLAIIALLVGAAVAASVVWSWVSDSRSTSTAEDNAFSLSELNDVSEGTIELADARDVAINGQLLVNNSFVLDQTSTTDTLMSGQIFVNSNGQLSFYDGDKATVLSQTVSSFGGATGDIQVGDGLNFEDDQVTNTGVLSFQGLSGDVQLVGGNGVRIDGNIISAIPTTALTASTGIEIKNNTIMNTGVQRLGGLSGAITLGQGLRVTGGNVENSGVVSVVSGSSNIMVSNDDGVVTIYDAGVGGGGTVALGPTAPQSDSSGRSSIQINKTGLGDFLEFQLDGVDRFTVNQNGLVTNGQISFDQVVAKPTFVNSLGGTTGDVVIGSGLMISTGTLSNTGVLSVTGSTDQIIVSETNGTYSFSTPQDINTTSSPSFANINASNDVTAIGTISGTALQQNDNQVCDVSGNCLGDGGGAANNAPFLTITNDPGLQNERALALGPNLSAVDNGVNGTYVLSVTDNPSFNSVTTPLIKGANLKVNANSGNLLFQTNDITRLSISETGQINLAELDCSALAGGGTLTTDGAGDLVCAADNDGGLVGSGTINQIAKFTNSGSLGDSSIIDDGASVSLNPDVNLTLQGSGSLSVAGNASVGANLTVDGRVVLQEGTTPMATAGYGKLFIRSSDSGLYYLTAAGAEYAVAGGSAGYVNSFNTLNGDLSLIGTSGQITVTDNSSDTITLSLNSAVSLLGQTIEGIEISNNTITANRLLASAPTDGQVLTYSASTGGFTWVNGSSIGAGGASTLQEAYVGGNTIATTNARDIVFTLSDTTTDANLLVDIANGSSSKFAVQSAGADVFSVNNTGQVAIKNSANSTTALNVQNAASESVFNIDTTNTRVGVGTASADAKLHVAETPRLLSGEIVKISQNGTTTTDSSQTSTLLNVERNFDVNFQSSNPVTLDSTSNPARGVSTFSHTVGASGNQVLIVQTTHYDTTSNPVSGITYDGIPLTKHSQIQNNSGLYVDVGTSIWYLVNPPTGVADVVITGNSFVDAFSSSWYNVDQSTPLYNGKTLAGSISPYDLTLTTEPGDIAIDSIINENQPMTMDPSQTLLFNTSNTNYTGGSGGSYEAATGSSVNMAWTMGSTREVAMAAAVINNAPSTGGPAISGNLATLSSNCTISFGSCSDSSRLLFLNQQYASATGNVLDIQNAGSGHSLAVNSTDLVVAAGGNVGIGIDAPNTRLDIQGGNLQIRDDTGSGGAPTTYEGNGLVVGNAGAVTDNNNNALNFYAGGAFAFFANADGDLTTPELYVGSGGDVGIGVTPTQKLDINGSLRIRTTSANAGTTLCRSSSGVVGDCSSLREYKTDISDLNIGSLNTIRQLQARQYNWKEDGSADLGFIAEEVEAVNPLLAQYGQDGELSGVKYSHLSALFAQGIQELDSQVIKLDQTKAAKSAQSLQNQRIDKLTTKVDANGEFIKQADAHYLSNGEPAVFTSLNVSGVTELGGELLVKGDVTFEQKLVVRDDLAVHGHIITGNQVGKTTVAAGVAACTSPRVTISGNDTAGTITITAGSDCSDVGELASITFANEFADTPRVQLTAKGEQAAKLQYYNGSANTTNFTVDVATTLTDTSTYEFNYLVVQ